MSQEPKPHSSISLRRIIETVKSQSDRFLPSGINHTEQQIWRYSITVVLTAAFTFFVFSVFTFANGNGLASLLFGTANILLLLPLLARRFQSISLLASGTIWTIVVTLFLIVIGKGSFALSSVMWFAILPVGALTVLGRRAMWMSLGLILVAGTSAFILTYYFDMPTPYRYSESMQSRVDFITWLFFIIITVKIGRGFVETLERTQVERNTALEKLESEKRLRAVGELAGGVAHEFNNLLAVIQGTADTLVTEATDDDLKDSLNDILGATHRGAMIAKELLLFSRGDTREAQRTNCTSAGDVFDMCSQVLLPLLGTQVQIVHDVHDTTPVQLSARNLEQCIVNLALNARDAMPEGGELHIRLCDVELGTVEAKAIGLRAGRWVLLAFTDTGVGMSSDTLARAFEPFFSTKSDACGLGLSMVFGVVTAQGGAVVAQSELEKGTTLSLYLSPASNPTDAVAAVSDVGNVAGEEANIEVQQSANSVVETMAGVPRTVVADTESLVEPSETPCVLVIDDQSGVRRMAKRMLMRKGFAVIEAESGIDALVWMHSSERIDLVLSDVRMPQMDGITFAEQLRETGLCTPIIFMTGFAGSDEEEKPLWALGETVLRKPFSPQELVAAIKSAIHTDLEGGNGLDSPP